MLNDFFQLLILQFQFFNSYFQRVACTQRVGELLAVTTVFVAVDHVLNVQDMLRLHLLQRRLVHRPQPVRRRQLGL
jgi:hypothetical protein